MRPIVNNEVGSVYQSSEGLYSKYIKRSLDFSFALLTIIILSPFLLLVSILIKFDSKGPVFFKQVRPGKNIKLFHVYKFRTMVQDAVIYQKVGEEVRGHDSRVTKLGRFLRRYKIDELAQLINILKGDMSIVGPRPTLPDYIDQYEEWELKRFDVRPGLTGLAQVNGNIYLDLREKSLYDIKYIEKISFINDMQIVFKTFAIVVIGEEKFLKKLN